MTPLEILGRTNRLRRGRELAGLSLAQTERLSGVGRAVLDDMESGRVPLEDDVTAALSKLYGASVAWLRGDEIPVPESLRKQLRDADVSPHDRDAVLEFAQMLGGRTSTVRLCRPAVADPEPPNPAAQQPRARKVRYVKSQGQTRKHHCHWPRCDKQVPPAMWGCKAHWFRLPKALRDRIWATYAPGQEVDLTPSREYLQVADDVQQWIREQESK